MARPPIQLNAAAVLEQYNDCKAALLHYFSEPERDPARFAGMAPAEVQIELRQRLFELELTQSLILVTTIEAIFRIDFERRCSAKKKEPLTKIFRTLKRRQGDKVRLDEDILEAWKASGLISAKSISEIRMALQLRHWLAHGRYWTLRSGLQFDFDDLFVLTQGLEDTKLLLA